MSSVFRGKFITQLKKRLPKQITVSLLNNLYKQSWVVFAKKPFESPHSVIEYLGRYTHKIAISNHRLQKLENGKVDFTYKDYRHGGVTKTMQLEAMEFIRRFSMHILPKGFVRIRHYGILSSTSKQRCAEAIKAQRLNEIILQQTKLSHESNKKDLGKTYKVLAESISKRSDKHLSGRSTQNKVVIFPRGNYNPGDYVFVKITECTPATLIGETI